MLLKAYFDEFKHAGDDSNVVLVILTNAYHSSDGTREFWKEAMARLAECGARKRRRRRERERVGTRRECWTWTRTRTTRTPFRHPRAWEGWEERWQR